MNWLAPVALIEHPSSVPKNQYRIAITMATNRITTIIGFLNDNSLTYLDDTIKLYLSTLIGKFDLENEVVPKPIICRLIEYRANCVKIPARIAGILSLVIRIPVISPASMPTKIEQIRASHIGQPFTRRITHVAPPVHNEPSTVKSAISNIL